MVSDAIAAARAIRVLEDAGIPLNFELVLAVNYRKLIRPGDVVIDIGAHSGAHTAQFLECVGSDGRVIAVEPLPMMFAYLRDRYGELPNMALHNLALADADGEAEFTIAQGALEESGLRERTYNSADVVPEKIRVAVARVDTLFADLPAARFVKIDVEGAELRLLDGARDFLARTRPYLSVEYGYPSYSAYGNDAMSLFAFAAQAGYLCADLYGNVIETAEDWRRICDWAYWDYLLVPADRREEFTALVRRR